MLKGGQCVTVKCDCSNLEEVQNSGKVANEAFGPVDILINNAGIVSGKKILDNSFGLMKKTLMVNTLAHL